MRELTTPAQAAQWLRSQVTGALQTDSRQLRAGDGFIAWPGAASDGRQYVNAALAQGAAACLVEAVDGGHYGFDHDRVAAYTGLKAASGPIAAAYYEAPSTQLDVLAVTGTNGKTSTSWWLAQALSALTPPLPCGLIGTLGIGRAPQPGQLAAVESSGLTTPDPVLLQRTLRRFVDEGLSACAIEASSIGVEESRLAGTQIRTAIFTNFTQDHLDYHGSMDGYWQAKAALFDWPGLQAAVINVDDEKGVELAEQLSGRALDVWTVSCAGPARLQARDITFEGAGLRFTVCEGAQQQVLATALIGRFNVANLLGVIGALRSLGVPLVAAVAACHGLQPVPGRMEIVQLEASAGATPLVVVDYAHTPDALAQVLLALRPLAAQRGGQLWCVFGCGGERDPLKRPLMGAVAGQQADQVVLTSDNPRREKAEAIISQILLGLEGHADVSVQPDRALAIAQALQQAGAHDVLLVAGKGHEDYQDIGGARRPFSDREQVRRALQARASAATPGAHA